jgi:type II secretory pathway component GspD/PulD (secretin)
MPLGYVRKLLLIMRLTTVILIASFMQLSAAGFAQKITISKKNVPLSQIINEIRDQSGYDFFYSNELLKKASPVSINVKDASLEDVLQICFKNQPITYKVDDKAVMLREKEKILSDKVYNFFLLDILVTVTNEEGKPLPGATVTIKENQ